MQERGGSAPLITVVKDVEAHFRPDFAGDRLIVQTDWKAPRNVSDAYANSVAAARLDLPCGYYYLIWIGPGKRVIDVLGLFDLFIGT